MVRINLITPQHLTDQHLVAEYNEILMLFGTVERHPEIRKMPSQYVLGAGHITFFKNKLCYLQQRHELLKEEMRKRAFEPTKTIDLRKYPQQLRNEWKPTAADKSIIKERIRTKLLLKPQYYRYYGKPRSPEFLLDLLRKAP